MNKSFTLYHGTIHDFTEIDVHRGKPFHMDVRYRKSSKSAKI